MKKLTIILLLISFQLASFAQEKKLRLGIGVTPQVSWMKTDATTAEGNGSKLGLNFGLMADYFIAENYSITTGLQINNTGGNIKYKDSTLFATNQETVQLYAGDNVKYKIQYLDIPFAFKMETDKIGYFSYYGQFGITNHIRVGAKADVKSAGGNLSNAGCKDEVAFFSMSYNIGGGATYYFSKKAGVTGGIIYNHGFIDATTNQDVNDNTSVRSIMLKLGVIF